MQRGLLGNGVHELGRERPAFQEHDEVGLTLGSISHEHTFHDDARDQACVEGLLCALCERACWRARGRGVKARTVTLKLRYTDFDTISRSRTLRPTASEFEVFPVLRELLARARTRPLPLRLIGVALSNLGYYNEQLELFDELGPVHKAVDEVRDDYGFDALRVALSKARSKNTRR
jgi:DNA polymerase-4